MVKMTCTLRYAIMTGIAGIVLLLITIASPPGVIREAGLALCCYAAGIITAILFDREERWNE